MTKLSYVLVAVVLPLAADGQSTRVPDVLPAPATRALGVSARSIG